MNCKPGDLALITRDSTSVKLAGRMVEVLYRAPIEDFNLPDGHLHDGQAKMAIADQWVLKFANPVSAPMRGWQRMTHYGCVPDRYLRPLRGDIDDIEVPTSTPVETCR